MMCTVFHVMISEREQKIIDKLLGIEDFHVVPVRVSDTDLMSVVHSNTYLNYFDEGFISFTSKLNKDCGALHKEGIVFPVRKVEIEYIKSATFGDNILIHTRVTKIGNTSITLAMNCYKNTKSQENLLVTATIVRLIMDMNSDKLIKITDFFNDSIS